MIPFQHAPEITSAVTALARGQHSVGAGVVIGSNVFNLAALLGLSAVAAGQIAWRAGRLARVTVTDEGARQVLIRRGFALEWVTLCWNVAGIVVLAFAAVAARSVALAGFGLDSLIEIGASTVVIWELSGTGAGRQRRGLQLIGSAFAALAAYLLIQSTVVLAAGYVLVYYAVREVREIFSR